MLWQIPLYSRPPTISSGKTPAVVHHGGDGAHAGGIGRSSVTVLASDKGPGFCAGRNPLASVVCTASIRTLTTVVAVEQVLQVGTERRDTVCSVSLPK
jgi:hypothetical protein